METETQTECLKQERVNFEKKLLFDSKKFVVRFRFYWRPLEEFHFHWRGLKSHVFQFETLRMLIYNPLVGSDIYPEGL